MISGAQLGILIACCNDNAKDVLKDIQEHQFIMETNQPLNKDIDMLVNLIQTIIGDINELPKVQNTNGEQKQGQVQRLTTERAR